MPISQPASRVTSTTRVSFPLKVLVIDDDEIARELLSSTLSQAGHQAFELASQVGATQLIFEQKVDAVVLDVMMPNMNGDRIAKVLRASANGDRLGIVLVSGQPVDHLHNLARQADADAVVVKRDICSELVRRVEGAVKVRTEPNEGGRITML